MAKPELRYWDSCCFIAYLGNETGKQVCESVLTAATSGRVRIVTSALTIAEVLKPKGREPLDSSRDVVRKFFMHEFIVIRQLDRVTAELAQEVFWQCSVDPKDAVHVATALRAGAPLETFDVDLRKQSGLRIHGLGPLVIREPEWQHPEQMQLEAPPG